MDGTSDPVVYVEVAGESQHTSIQHSKVECVWDHHMFFTFPRRARAEIEALTVKVAVYDANFLARNVLIGQFTFDALEIYYQPHHQYYKR